MNKKDNHPKKICQSIYWNLIKMLDRKENLEPVHILSEFWCTKKCDYIHDMSKLREKTKEYMNKINPDSFERMFQPDWNKEDKDVALRTSIHYNLIYRKELMSGLKKSGMVDYYFKYKTQTILTKLGILSGSIYTGKIIWKNTHSRSDLK